MRAFLFYVDDWLSSKKIARMDAHEERGFLRLLLYAATEPDCGLPTDTEELANISLLYSQWNKPTKSPLKRFDGQTSGSKILACFVERDGRYYNERLLREFNHQKIVSEKRSKSGKLASLSRASKCSPIASANAEQLQVQTDEQNITNDVWGCVSSSPVEVLSKKTHGNQPSETSPRFAEWWELWSASRGTNHQNQAAQAWLGVVTQVNENAVFDCTRSYLASRGGPGGYNPENFLFDQARGLFQARWPPVRAKPGSEEKDEKRKRIFAEMMARNLERMGENGEKETDAARS